MTPKHYVPRSPEKKSKLFPEDTSPVSDSDFEDGDSTLTYAAKVMTKKPKKFRFRKIVPKQEKSPSSSPLKWPPSPIVISTDKELENSMVELEKQVSLELTDSSD